MGQPDIIGTSANGPLSVGDRLSIDVRVRRKWWQFWKPREWAERREFRVAAKLVSDAPCRPLSN